MRIGLALVAVVAGVATAGCMFASRGIGTSGLRRFYLTKETVQGNRMLTACAAGYHAASRFELLDVSHLAYDSERGVVTDDAGYGPPSRVEAYGSPDPTGWIRTGGTSSFTDGARAAGAAFTNCATWTSASHDAYGTVAYLSEQFAGASVPAGVWNGGSQPCDIPAHVWCVENHEAAAGDSGETGGRRRRGEGS
jgi:hypothetical protein